MNRLFQEARRYITCLFVRTATCGGKWDRAALGNPRVKPPLIHVTDPLTAVTLLGMNAQAPSLNPQMLPLVEKARALASAALACSNVSVKALSPFL